MRHPEEIARNADLAGWSAALLFAFCFLHVQDCIYTRVESMLSLLTILTLWLMLNLIRRSTFGSMSIAGLVTGITIAASTTRAFGCCSVRDHCLRTVSVVAVTLREDARVVIVAARFHRGCDWFLRRHA